MKAFLLTALITIAPLPALAQSDTCFMKTSDGRIIPLGKLCQKPSQPAQPATPQNRQRTTQQVQPIVKPLKDSLFFSDLKVRLDYKNRYLSILSGKVQNISDKPVTITFLRFQIEDNSGNVLGQTLMQPSVTLEPRQIYEIKHRFDRDAYQSKPGSLVQVKVSEIL